MIIKETCLYERNKFKAVQLISVDQNRENNRIKSSKIWWKLKKINEISDMETSEDSCCEMKKSNYNLWKR